MILIIDNYDSFVYNLYHLFSSFEKVLVMRNDVITTEQIIDLNPSLIILSPGPGFPKDAGVTLQVVRDLGGKIPIFGVCLGFQAICETFGWSVKPSGDPCHGIGDRLEILDSSDIMYSGFDAGSSVGRYHSLMVTEQDESGYGSRDDSKNLEVTSYFKTLLNGQKVIASVRHKTLPIFGVQYHPESILTNQRDILAQNIISLCQPR